MIRFVVQESETEGASEATVPGMARLYMCSLQKRGECSTETTTSVCASQKNDCGQ